MNVDETKLSEIDKYLTFKKEDPINSPVGSSPAPKPTPRKRKPKPKKPKEELHPVVDDVILQSEPVKSIDELQEEEIKTEPVNSEFKLTATAEQALLEILKLR